MNVAVTCAETQLAPGTSTRCSADYTVTRADVQAGDIRNVATAVGSATECDDVCAPITSGPDDTLTPVDAKGLAATGGAMEWTVVAIASLLIAGGVIALVRGRRKQDA